MANIYKIAEKAGLSPSTVARALNGKGYCKKETKEKVLAIAEEMNYSPVHAARMLKNKRTEKILFCIPDIYNPFYFGMIQGANDVLEKNGYFTVLCHTNHDIKKEIKMLNFLRERYGDGMIFVSFSFNEENISAVNQCKMPVVLTNKYDSEHGNDRFDYVHVDTKSGIKMATEHLINEGHKKIAFLGGLIEEQTGKERYDGYCEALEQAGIEMDKDLVFEGDYKRFSGEEWARMYLDAKDKPTALVATNDLMALGVMNICHDNNIKIPDDLAIVGMDDTYLAGSMIPKLTSVSIQEEEIGRAAATLLLERIEQGREKRSTIELRPILKIRESSKK